MGISFWHRFQAELIIHFPKRVALFGRGRARLSKCSHIFFWLQKDCIVLIMYTTTYKLTTSTIEEGYMEGETREERVQGRDWRGRRR